MNWDRQQLAALAAVVRAGTFEAAARELNVTPSAISQRVKALEGRTGQVLVRRGRPSTPTEAGNVLVRLASQTELLELEAAAGLEGSNDHPSMRIAIAVNADSLSTWFLPVLPEIAASHRVTFDVHKEDEDYTAQMLRDGTVMAAVTTEPVAVQGCRSVRLGAIRYLPMATRSFRDRYLTGHAPLGTQLAHAPMLNFNRKDTLQLRYLRRLTRRRTLPPIHYVPSSTAFTEAARLGLGWGMIPEHDLRDDESRADGLVHLGGKHIDVPLYWQHWRLESELLRALTAGVRARAELSLR